MQRRVNKGGGGGKGGGICLGGDIMFRGWYLINREFE